MYITSKSLGLVICKISGKAVCMNSNKDFLFFSLN